MQHATDRSPLAISLGMAIALITPSARADCFDDAAYQQVTASQKNNCAKNSSRCATKRTGYPRSGRELSESFIAESEFPIHGTRHGRRSQLPRDSIISALSGRYAHSWANGLRHGPCNFRQPHGLSDPCLSCPHDLTCRRSLSPAQSHDKEVRKANGGTSCRRNAHFLVEFIGSSNARGNQAPWRTTATARASDRRPIAGGRVYRLRGYRRER